MAPSFVLGMADYLCERGDGLDRTTLLGGEPTLHPQITEIANEMADRPIRERRMTTNATSLNRLKLDQLRPDAFDHVSLSVDGITAEVNDATRGRGTFKKILGTLALYHEAGVRLSVNYTMTQRNLSTMRDAAAFFAGQGVAIVNFHCASLTGNALSNPELVIPPLDWVEARDELLDDATTRPENYAGALLRVPYTYLTPTQMTELGYEPIQERNYHSPQGGHRLIVLPPTAISRGLCYMSSDLIGVAGAELGTVSPTGKFSWNDAPTNELTAYQAAPTANVSTDIKGQRYTESAPVEQLERVSHSFKAVIQC